MYAFIFIGLATVITLLSNSGEEVDRTIFVIGTFYLLLALDDIKRKITK